MNPILESCPVRDGLVGLWVPAARSFRDFSENDNHAAPTGCRWRRVNGVYSLDFTGAGLLEVLDSVELRLTQATFFLWGNLDRYTSFDRLVSKFDAGGTNWDLFLGSTTQFSLTDSVVTRTAIVNWLGAKSLAVTVGEAAIGIGYTNGAFAANFNGVSTLVADDAPLYIGNRYTAAANRPQKNPIKGVAVYNVPKLADDIAALHTWSRSLTSPSVQADRRYFDMGSLVPVEDDAIAAWDLGDVRNREVVDSSGNSHTGTLIGKVAPVETVIGRALRNTDGPDAVEVASLTIVDDITMEALVLVRSAGGGSSGRVYQTGSSEFYFTGTPVGGFRWKLVGITGTDFLGVNTAIGENIWMHTIATRRRSDGLVRIYINGSQVYATTGGTEAITISGALRLLNLTTIRPFDGDCKFIKFYQRYMEADEVAYRYAPIARKVMFEETFEYVPPTISNLTSGKIPGTDYTISTGTWKVDEGLVDGRWRTWIECVVSGILWRDQFEEYGTWDFDICKSGSSNSRIHFIAGEFSTAGNLSYRIELRGDEGIWFTETGKAIHFQTLAGYITPDVKYKYRITRSTTGVFSCYIKGERYPEWTLIDPTGGTGTNPFTDSTVKGAKFYLFDMDAGDRIYLDHQMLGPVIP